MKKDLIKKILAGAGILIALNVLYLVFMVACFSVPVGERARVHLEETMEILAPETRESPVFRNVKTLSTGLFTDMLWIDTAIMHEESALMMAVELPHKEKPVGDMWFPNEGFEGLMIPVMYYYDAPDVITRGYSRYWMLFTGLLRILFQFFAWNEIRYFFWTLAAALLLYDGCLLTLKAGWRAAVPFGVAVMMRNLLFHVVSFTTCTDSITTFAGIAFLLTFYEKKWFQRNRWLFYLVLGSLTFAIGTMEAPLLILGMTLITELLLMSNARTERDGRLSRQENRKAFADLLLVSVLWCVGYASAAIGKGILSYAMIGGTGAGEVAFSHYLSGNGRGPFVRLYRILYCLDIAFSPMQIKIPFLILLVIALMIMARKRGAAMFPYFWQIAMISLYPVVWVMVVVEHSIHNYASNIFAILVYGVLALLCGVIKKTAGEPNMTS